jgi:hypothetical protein
VASSFEPQLDMVSSTIADAIGDDDWALLALDLSDAFPSMAQARGKLELEASTRSSSIRGGRGEREWVGGGSSSSSYDTAVAPFVLTFSRLGVPAPRECQRVVKVPHSHNSSRRDLISRSVFSSFHDVAIIVVIVVIVAIVVSTFYYFVQHSKRLAQPPPALSAGTSALPLFFVSLTGPAFFLLSFWMSPLALGGRR